MARVLKFPKTVMDGLRNVASNLMTSRDKQSHTTYENGYLTLADVQAAYKTAWLPQKIVDIPAQDACRAWREWDAEPRQVQLIAAEEKRLNLRKKVEMSLISARLYGGSALYIGTGDANLREPLIPGSVGKGGLRTLVCVPRFSMNPGPVEQDIESPWFGKPQYWSFSSDARTIEVHPSRVVLFFGHRIPETSVLPSFQWGDSILEAVLDAIKQSDQTTANVSSLVFEAKVDVLSIPNLMDEIGDAEYERKLTDRLALANLQKGINGMFVKDSEEEYEQKKMQFTTLPEVMDRFFQNVAGAADIPMTRLFGMSPGGMNATGDSDLKNYYDKISSMQEMEITPEMALLDEVLVRSAIGYTPRNVTYTWRPLWQTPKKELGEISTQIATTIKTMKDTGIFKPESLLEVAKSSHLENGLIIGADKLEFEKEELPPAPALPGAAPLSPSRPRLVANDGELRTLYVRRDVLNAREIKAWARKYGLEAGLKKDLHVTILYSKAPVDWFKMGQAWSEKLEIPAGGPRAIERFGQMGQHVVLRFAGEELAWRHDMMIDRGASHDFDEYSPHITLWKLEGETDLSDVEPYQGKIVLGPEIFEEVEE